MVSVHITRLVVRRHFDTMYFIAFQNTPEWIKGDLSSIHIL